MNSWLKCGPNMRTKSNFKLAKKAKADLESIWLYGLETWSLRHADEYIAGLHEKFEFLAKWPSAGRHAVTLRSGYSRFEFQSHTIFYKIGKNGIIIIRVLHEKMDATRHL